MDIATIIGIICGFLCIIVSVVSGGSAAIFIHIPSMMIVVGGMVCSTLIHFSLPQVLRIIPIIKKTILCKIPKEQDLIQKMMDFSVICRRDGVLALEQKVANEDDPFLVKALQLVVDGQEPGAIENALSTEIDSLQHRHSDGKMILEFMGASAPAFGMIGTLIGLVSMLNNLSDPSGLGAGMAVALITTFYGALLANVLFNPLAGKLGIRSKQEARIREMIMEGTIGIAMGESPTAVRERMQAFLSASHREEVKPTIGGEKSKAA